MPSPQSVVGNGMIIDMLFEGKCLRKGTTFAPGVVLCPRGRALLAGKGGTPLREGDRPGGLWHRHLLARSR